MAISRSMSKRWTPSGVHGTNPVRVAQRQLRHVFRVEAVDVLSRIERADDSGLIDLFGRRRLNEDPVDCRVAIQLLYFA